MLFAVCARASETDIRRFATPTRPLQLTERGENPFPSVALGSLYQAGQSELKNERANGLCAGV